MGSALSPETTCPRAADVMYESALARLRDVMRFDLGSDWEPAAVG